MSLVLGLIAGLAYGLSVFAGAFVAVPLLVLFAGLSILQALPIALFALGVCAAIAAGDAVRARQCDVQLAGWIMAGAMPVVLVAGALIFLLPAALLACLFLIVTLVAGALLIPTAWRAGPSDTLAPAALLYAPRRGLDESSQRHGYGWRSRSVLVAAGAASGALLALCAAPGALIGAHALTRRYADQPYVVAGTLAFALALLSIIGAGVEFLFAPVLPGYTAGLYVLGAMAGMGAARRVYPRLPIRATQIVIAAIVIVGALALAAAALGGFTTMA